MEKSNAQEAALNLGRQFVNQLGLDPGVDTFGRWMVHYIAEQMIKAEHAQGMDKEAAEKNCFDTILKFWQHRWQLPSGLRPFENFESILSLIERLDPEQHNNFYDRYFPDLMDDQKSVNDKQSEWVGFAETIDKVARICIEFAIDQHVEEMEHSEIENWLKYGSEIESGIDMEIMGNLTDLDLSSFLDEYKEDQMSVKKSTDEALEKYNAERIKTRIQNLEEFSKINGVVLKKLKASLKKIEK